MKIKITNHLGTFYSEELDEVPEIAAMGNTKEKIKMELEERVLEASVGPNVNYFNLTQENGEKLYFGGELMKNSIISIVD